MEADEIKYRKSVRNTSILIGIVILIIVLSLLIPPIFNPPKKVFGGIGSTESAYGFDLYLKLDKGYIQKGTNITASAWIMNGAGRINNVTAMSNWPLQGLYSKCSPLAIGIIKGYYEQANITRGSFIDLNNSKSCESENVLYYLLEPMGTNGIAFYQGGARKVSMNISISLSGYYEEGRFLEFKGVYTVVAADEWGDIVLLYFFATD
jgi:hypothetical protein